MGSSFDEEPMQSGSGYKEKLPSQELKVEAIKKRLLENPQEVEHVLISFQTFHWTGFNELVALRECEGEVLRSPETMRLLISALEYAYQMLDIRVRFPFGRLFQNAFRGLPHAHQRQDALRLYYNRYSHLPKLDQKMFPQFKEELESLVSAAGGQDAINRADSLGDQLSWFLLVSPVDTLWALFVATIKNKDSAVVYAKMLNAVPALDSVRCPDTKKRLVVAGLRRFLEKHLDRILEQQQAFIDFTVTLVCGDVCLVRLDEALDEFVAAMLNSAPPGAHEFANALGERLLIHC